jgi:hypothetical protein
MEELACMFSKRDVVADFSKIFLLKKRPKSIDPSCSSLKFLHSKPTSSSQRAYRNISIVLTIISVVDLKAPQSIP